MAARRQRIKARPNISKLVSTQNENSEETSFMIIKRKEIILTKETKVNEKTGKSDVSNDLKNDVTNVTDNPQKNKEEVQLDSGSVDLVPLTTSLVVENTDINGVTSPEKSEEKNEFENGAVDQVPLSTSFVRVEHEDINGVTRSVAEHDLDMNAKSSVMSSSQKNEQPSNSNNESFESSIPIPKLKIGPNGEITIDEESLYIAPTAPVLSSTICEASPTTYASFREKRTTCRWDKEDTVVFYRALSVVGTDFSIMEKMLKKRWSRTQLKNKFKREQKMNPALVDKIMTGTSSFTDLQLFEEDLKEKANNTKGR